jgi:hypothetical protein
MSEIILNHHGQVSLSILERIFGFNGGFTNLRIPCTPLFERFFPFHEGS